MGSPFAVRAKFACCGGLGLGETTIDSSSVHPLDLGKVFKGFEKGDHVIMGIGTTRVVEVKAEMLTYWVALMDVE